MRTVRCLVGLWLLTWLGCSPAPRPVELPALYEDYAAFDGHDVQVRGVVLSDTEGFSMTLPVAGDRAGYPMLIRFDDTAWNEEGRRFYDLLLRDNFAEARLKGRFHGKSPGEALPTPDGPMRFILDVTAITEVRQLKTPAP